MNDQKHVLASCALLLEHPRGRWPRDILLAERLTAHGTGKLGVPAGKIDVGDKVIDAMRRELLEETRLMVADIRPINFVTNSFYGSEGRQFVCQWFVGRFPTETRDIDISFVEHDAAGSPKSGGWEWYSHDRLRLLHEAGKVMPGEMDAWNHLLQHGANGQGGIMDYVIE